MNVTRRYPSSIPWSNDPTLEQHDWCGGFHAETSKVQAAEVRDAGEFRAGFQSQPPCVAWSSSSSNQRSDSSLMAMVIPVIPVPNALPLSGPVGQNMRSPGSHFSHSQDRLCHLQLVARASPNLARTESLPLEHRLQPGSSCLLRLCASETTGTCGAQRATWGDGPCCQKELSMQLSPLFVHGTAYSGSAPLMVQLVAYSGA